MELMIAQQWDGVKWENMSVFWMVGWGYIAIIINTYRKEREIYGRKLFS